LAVSVQEKIGELSSLKLVAYLSPLLGWWEADRKTCYPWIEHSWSVRAQTHLLSDTNEKDGNKIQDRIDPLLPTSGIFFALSYI